MTPFCNLQNVAKTAFSRDIRHKTRHTQYMLWDECINLTRMPVWASIWIELLVTTSRHVTSVLDRKMYALLMICSLNNHTYRIHKTNTYVQTSTMTACSDNLPSNDGLLSGDLCQHWTIHFLANDSKSWGPVISLTGGRLPAITAVFTCSSLVADKRNVQQISYSAQAGGKWCHH